ncbi:17657_t:CDS:2 [Acaulospora morrowiae]|uniref:17657_t:CDS:1 n=1 Tax=Acaulospora morrowiae TaxID=94023 RepID=A0A9N9B6Y9_9GLOM|nr:17657_t:CDS:2 [Acaulospora morrowiae]
MHSHKGVSLILHKKVSPPTSPSSPSSPFSSHKSTSLVCYKSSQEYVGPHAVSPVVDYVRWLDLCESSDESAEIFAIFPHKVILRIFQELDFTDIVSFSMVSRRCMTHTLDPSFWHSILKRDWKDWRGYSEVLKQYNIAPIWNGNIKSTEEDTLALKHAYLTLATCKLPLAERRDYLDSTGSWWAKDEFKLVNSKESEFGKVIKQKTKLFQCSVSLKYPPKGWYDVVWRMKIDKLVGEPEFGFNTTVETMDIRNKNPSNDRYSYVATKQDFAQVIGKGWFYFVLPYAVLVEPYKTVRNLKEMKLRKAMKINFEFTTFNKNAQWDFGSGHGFTIDYVAIRPHIHYNIPRANRYSSGSNSSHSSSDSGIAWKSARMIQRRASVILGPRWSAKLLD